MKDSHSPAPEHPSRLGSLLESVVARVTARPRLVLAVALLFATASVYLAATQLRYRTSRDDLMSAHKDYQQRWQRYLAEFGDDDDMVVVVEGDSRADRHATLERIADGVRRHPDLFDRLFYKVDLRHLSDRAMLHLPLSEIEKIAAQVESVGVLLGPLGPIAWRSMTLQSLLMQAAGCAERLAQGEALSETDRSLWKQLPGLLRSADATLRDPTQYRSPWAGLTPVADDRGSLDEVRYFESDSGALAFLLVRPIKDAIAPFTPAQRSIGELRSILAEVQTASPSVRLGLTGLPVLEHDEMSATEVDANRAAWLALAGVTLLYFVVYRGFRYPCLTVLTLVVGTVWSLGWLTLTVGHLNLLSATFAVMLIGMGDYGVLWVARYDSERQAGRADAMRRTARLAGPSIVTAAATTSLAFFATMLADFQAVRELGWIAGTGVILCALACFTVLPAMMALLEPYRQTPKEPVPENRSSVPLRRPASMEAWMPALASRPRSVLAGAALLTAVFGVAALGLRYDHNLLHMQPKGLDSVAWELRLLEETTGAGWHALSIATTREEALALKAKFERLPEVSRVVEVASLVPADQDAKRVIFERLQAKLRFLPADGHAVERPAPDADAIRWACRLLMREIEALPAGERIAESALLAFWRSLEAAPSEVVVTHIETMERRMSADLAGDFHRLRKVTAPRALTPADLPADLRERHIGASGQYLLRVFAKDCLWEIEPLDQFVRAVRSVDPEATGKPFGTLEGLRSMKAGFEWAGVYALLAIVFVLTIDFRDVGHVLLALLPLVLGVVASLGLLALCGVPMNPANLIGLPLIVGVGVDNGVHVLHDYRERVPGKRYRLSEPTGKGIMVAALTTMLGFGALMLGRHQGQSGLGLTLTLGVGCCMLAALLVLPAVLRLIEDRAAEASPAVLRFPRRKAA